MFPKIAAAAVLIAAGFLAGCGTASTGPEGSKHQSETGVSASGYPAGEPKDAGSPALASSSETRYAGNESGQPDAKPK